MEIGIGDKVKVKAGLGGISLSEGNVIKINEDKATVYFPDFPWVCTKEIYLEDLILIKKAKEGAK